VVLRRLLLQSLTLTPALQQRRESSPSTKQLRWVGACSCRRGCTAQLAYVDLGEVGDGEGVEGKGGRACRRRQVETRSSPVQEGEFPTAADKWPSLERDVICCLCCTLLAQCLLYTTGIPGLTGGLDEWAKALGHTVPSQEPVEIQLKPALDAFNGVVCTNLAVVYTKLKQLERALKYATMVRPAGDARRSGLLTPFGCRWPGHRARCSQSQGAVLYGSHPFSPRQFAAFGAVAPGAGV